MNNHLEEILSNISREIDKPGIPMDNLHRESAKLIKYLMELLVEIYNNGLSDRNVVTAIEQTLNTLIRHGYIKMDK